MTRGEDRQLEDRLGYRFREPDLLDRALTHSSAVPELRAARGFRVYWSFGARRLWFLLAR